MRVKIETQEQAIHFVDICNRYPNDDIDLIFQRFIVDAKSILGVMALMGYGKKLEVNFHGGENILKFMNDIKDYYVGE